MVGKNQFGNSSFRPIGMRKKGLCPSLIMYVLNRASAWTVGEKLFIFDIQKPISVAALSKKWKAFVRSNIGIVGLNPKQGMDTCLCLFCKVAASRRTDPPSKETYWPSMIKKLKWNGSRTHQVRARGTEERERHSSFLPFPVTWGNLQCNRTGFYCRNNRFIICK
jgi:hypothetical protein